MQSDNNKNFLNHRNKTGFKSKLLMVDKTGLKYKHFMLDKTGLKSKHYLYWIKLD